METNRDTGNKSYGNSWYLARLFMKTNILDQKKVHFKPRNACCMYKSIKVHWRACFISQDYHWDEIGDYDCALHSEQTQQQYEDEDSAKDWKFGLWFHYIGCHYQWSLLLMSCDYTKAIHGLVWFTCQNQNKTNIRDESTELKSDAQGSSSNLVH